MNYLLWFKKYIYRKSVPVKTNSVFAIQSLQQSVLDAFTALGFILDLGVQHRADGYCGRSSGLFTPAGMRGSGQVRCVISPGRLAGGSSLNDSRTQLSGKPGGLLRVKPGGLLRVSNIQGKA